MAWTASSGAIRYDVKLWEGGAPSSRCRATQTRITLTGLRPNGQYYVSVVAVDSRGRKATSNLLVVVTAARPRGAVDARQTCASPA